MAVETLTCLEVDVGRLGERVGEARIEAESLGLFFLEGLVLGATAGAGAGYAVRISVCLIGHPCDRCVYRSGEMRPQW